MASPSSTRGTLATAIRFGAIRFRAIRLRGIRLRGILLGAIWFGAAAALGPSAAAAPAGDLEALRELVGRARSGRPNMRIRVQIATLDDGGELRQPPSSKIAVIPPADPRAPHRSWYDVRIGTSGHLLRHGDGDIPADPSVNGSQLICSDGWTWRRFEVEPNLLVVLHAREFPPDISLLSLFNQSLQGIHAPPWMNFQDGLHDRLVVVRSESPSPAGGAAEPDGARHGPEEGLDRAPRAGFVRFDFFDEPTSRSGHWVVFDMHADPPRLAGFGERSEVEDAATGVRFVMRLSEARVTAWRAFDGVVLPERAEMESTFRIAPDAAPRRMRGEVRMIDASRDDPLSVDADIANAIRPRPAERVYDGNLMLRFEQGGRTFTHQGQKYRAVEPLLDHPRERLPEILRSAELIEEQPPFAPPGLAARSAAPPSVQSSVAATPPPAPGELAASAAHPAAHPPAGERPESPPMPTARNVTFILAGLGGVAIAGAVLAMARRRP